MVQFKNRIMSFDALNLTEHHLVCCEPPLLTHSSTPHNFSEAPPSINLKQISSDNVRVGKH